MPRRGGGSGASRRSRLARRAAGAGPRSRARPGRARRRAGGDQGVPVAEPLVVVSETEATFDESSRTRRIVRRLGGGDEEAPTAGPKSAVPDPGRRTRRRAMFGEATIDESDDEKPAFGDAGDEDEAPSPAGFPWSPFVSTGQSPAISNGPHPGGAGH